MKCFLCSPIMLCARAGLDVKVQVNTHVMCCRFRDWELYVIERSTGGTFCRRSKKNRIIEWDYYHHHHSHQHHHYHHHHHHHRRRRHRRRCSLHHHHPHHHHHRHHHHGFLNYRQVSNMIHTWESNWIVDHSDVVGASPVGAAPTTSSFLT